MVADLYSSTHLKKFKQFCRDVWEAICGSEQSFFTEGSIGRAILFIMLLFIINAIFRSSRGCGYCHKHFTYCFWIIEIPLAYVLALQLNWGIGGVFWVIIFAESLLTLIAVYLFRQGKWKLKAV